VFKKNVSQGGKVPCVFCLLVVNSKMIRRAFRDALDKEPMVVVSIMLGLFGISLPLTVVPIRDALGMDTSQYHGFDSRKMGLIPSTKKLEWEKSVGGRATLVSDE